jgi:hypothetical protein
VWHLKEAKLQSKHKETTSFIAKFTLSGENGTKNVMTLFLNVVIVSDKVCQRPQQEREGVLFCPDDEAVVERLKTKACQPFDEMENPMHNLDYPF